MQALTKLTRGQVLYQFDNAVISHHFYFDQLGFADKKKLTDFLSDDNPEKFQHILHDFNFLIDDFFKGECTKLVEFSKLKDNIIYELDKNIRNENIMRMDNIRIEKARNNSELKISKQVLQHMEPL